MRISIGSDHAGFELKERLRAFLEARGIEVVDRGAHSGTDSVDYPDFAAQVATDVCAGAGEGVLVCGTGIGMSIAANKFPGVRAALVHDEMTARMAREHNNANILVLGGRLLDALVAEEMVATWLDGTFEERHQRRLDKIGALETGREPKG